MPRFSLACRASTFACLVVGALAAQAADIELDAAEAQRLGLRTEPAAVAEHIPLDHLPAEIATPLESARTISAPFAGVVASVAVDEGASVATGAPLARVQSRDFLAAQADLARSSSDATLAHGQAERDDTLLAEGIISRARADEARARARDAQARLAQARGALAQVALPAHAAAGEYELRAPVVGRVVRRSIAPGQVVAAFEPAFLLAADDAVDVVLQAPVAHRAAYTPGLTVVMADGARAGLVAVAAATESGSQSVRLRARLPASQHWLIGQRTSARLELPAPPGSVRVPLAALVPDGEHTLVFVANGRRYAGVRVERLGADARNAIVRGALKPGDAIVTSGASTLKSLHDQ